MIQEHLDSRSRNKKMKFRSSKYKFHYLGSNGLLYYSWEWLCFLAIYVKIFSWDFGKCNFNISYALKKYTTMPSLMDTLEIILFKEM